MKAARIWTVALVGLLVVGCKNSEASDDAADGPAPVIADLALSPDEVEVGKKTTLEGTLSFEDTEGDAKEVGVELTLPNGTKQEVGTVEAQGVSGVKKGTITFSLMLSLPVAGDYEVEVFVVDEEGNESNHVSATLAAAE